MKSNFTVLVGYMRLPGEGGEPSSFHLNLPSAARVFPEQLGVLPRWSLHLPQVAGCPVPQLPGEMTELVAAVAVSRGFGSRQHLGSAEILGPQGILQDLVRAEPQQSQSFGRHGHEANVAQRLRLHPGETSTFDLADSRLLGRVQGEFPQGCVVELEALQRGTTDCVTHIVHPDSTEESEHGHTGNKEA